MSQRESIQNTFFVAGTLCIACSILVSAAAVGLKGIQEANSRQLFQKQVLKVAGIFDDSQHSSGDIAELYKQVTPVLIDLDTGKPSEVDAETFDQRAASKDPALSEDIPADLDLAGLGRREKQSFVYLIKGSSDEIDKIILPIRGKGLWSTMWGLLALKADGKTVDGITFYEDGETPGLGGEINNPKWQSQWGNPDCPKVLFDESGDVSIRYIKDIVTCETTDSEHKFDALAGATITTRGVENMMKYWLGPHGFKPYLSQNTDTLQAMK